MTTSPQKLKQIADALPGICKQAAKIILNVYETDFETRTKTEGSPVTEADEQAEELIIAELRKIAPDIAIIAEESYEKGIIPSPIPDEFFLVDPLDGTKEFVSRRGEFTVNIALVVGKKPIIGAVQLPARDEVYWTDADGKAWHEDAAGEVKEIKCRVPADDGLVVVASRSHRGAATDELLETLNVKDITSSGSSLKICRVAEGTADLYPRLGRTMEWDTAAGHAVLLAAGGEITRLDGEPLEYGKDGTDNPNFIVRGLGSFESYGLNREWTPTAE